MEDILFSYIQEHLEDNDFMDSLCLVSKNSYIAKRRNLILKKKSAIILSDLIEFHKWNIVDDDFTELLSSYESLDGFKSLINILLKNTFLNPETKKCEDFKKYYWSGYGFFIEGKPTKFSFFKPSCINVKYSKINPIYRMYNCDINKLRNEYRNAQALIY
jgi:hypothetical protein